MPSASSIIVSSCTLTRLGSRPAAEIFLGLLIGIGVSVVAEILDPTVKDLEQLQQLLPWPVLGRIPHLAPDTTRAG